MSLFVKGSLCYRHGTAYLLVPFIASGKFNDELCLIRGFFVVLV